MASPRDELIALLPASSIVGPVEGTWALLIEPG